MLAKTKKNYRKLLLNGSVHKCQFEKTSNINLKKNSKIKLVIAVIKIRMQLLNDVKKILKITVVFQSEPMAPKRNNCYPVFKFTSPIPSFKSKNKVLTIEFTSV